MSQATRRLRLLCARRFKLIYGAIGSGRRQHLDAKVRCLTAWEVYGSQNSQGSAGLEAGENGAGFGQVRFIIGRCWLMPAGARGRKNASIRPRAALAIAGSLLRSARCIIASP